MNAPPKEDAPHLQYLIAQMPCPTELSTKVGSDIFLRNEVLKKTVRRCLSLTELSYYCHDNEKYKFQNEYHPRLSVNILENKQDITRGPSTGNPSCSEATNN